MTTARLGLLVIATAIQAVTCCLADTYGLPPPMPFEWELKLNKTALKESTPVVFRSQDEWADFWKQQDPQRKEAPQVDFATQMVVGFVAGKETVMVYRVELDDASGPKELLVRMASEDALDLNRSSTPSGTRLHLVAVPKSALPVRFVKDDMVDGGGYGAYPEGVERTDLGLIAGLAKPEESGKAVYREQAEKLVRDQLKEEDMKAARAKLHPPSLGRRYPEPSSRIDVRRQEKTWTIVYDAMRFQVDVASGMVTRMEEPTPQLPSKQTAGELPDVSRLKKGMLLSEFQAILGTVGDIQPQPSIAEAHYIFDLDEKFIFATVRTQPKPEVVNEFLVKKDDLTAVQRRNQRDKITSRAVVRPRVREPKGTPGEPAAVTE